MSERTAFYDECNACANADEEWYEIVYKLQDYDIYRCKKCGFFFVKKERDDTNPIINESSTQYHEKHEKRLRSIAKSQIRALDKLVGNLSGMRCLDVGAGNGYFLELAREKGMIVEGIEPDVSACEYAKVNSGLNISPIFAEQIGKFFRDRHFDLITMWGVIEHVQNPQKVLKAVKKLLGADGVLAIQTPTEDGFVRKAVHIFTKLTRNQTLLPELYNWDHVQCFSIRSITPFLIRNGFDIVKIESSSYGLMPLLQRSSLRGWSIMAILKRCIATSIFFVGLLTRKGNHMVVFAKPSGN